jgi:ribosomal protein L11 methylase PrmA
MMQRIASSFRDPSGYVYSDGSHIIRSVNKSYAQHYQIMQESGFLDEMWRNGWLVQFTEKDNSSISGAWKTLDTQAVPFISYPYEWSFSQLKNAALLTLDIQELALSKGLTLKDASAYNVQFVGTKPIFIDLLSPECYREGLAWAAYGQFCRHFLAPLLMAANVDIRTPLMLRDFIDGIPLDMASDMLPWRCRFSLDTQIHIYQHARMQKKYADSRLTADKTRHIKVSRQTLIRLVQNLRSLIERIKQAQFTTTWSDYYCDTNYSSVAFSAKHELVDAWLKKLQPASVLDMGANTGEFSHLAQKYASFVLAPDMDAPAVDRHYLELVKQNASGILPLVIDLSNPSPALGWHHRERLSFSERCCVDTVLALALIHHLHISNNVPLDMCADFFADLGKNLILEFVPKEDTQVQRLLSTREDIFPDYTLDNVITAFSRRYIFTEIIQIPDSIRYLLLFKAK